MEKINGMLASKGRIKGKVVYFGGMFDIEKVRSDSIVVANKFSKEYTEAIVKCGAFIATNGGVTSHAAIVCRELKKACVVSCFDAFEVFKEGQIIELNADLMEYKILE